MYSFNLNLSPEVSRGVLGRDVAMVQNDSLTALLPTRGVVRAGPRGGSSTAFGACVSASYLGRPSQPRSFFSLICSCSYLKKMFSLFYYFILKASFHPSSSWNPFGPSATIRS